MFRLIRLITLIALALLPLGMAPAAAAHAHSAAAASIPAEDCSGEGSRQHSGGGIGECAIPCASALAPMALPGEPLLPPFARDHGLPGTSNRLHGLVLEIATPPPRLS